MTTRSTYWRARPWPEWISMCRTWALATVGRWGIQLSDDLRTALELVVSELVTNTVRHGGPLQEYVTVRLLAVDDLLLLEVADTSHIHHLPERVEAADQDEGGRGLALVDVLAYQWGCYPTAEGKAVWALLGTPPESAPLPPLRLSKSPGSDAYQRAKPNPRIHDAIPA
jgi:Histidine kinase-like ATPase domain